MLNDQYMEALVYKNLLLRVQANLERNPARQQALLRKRRSCRTAPRKFARERCAARGAPGRPRPQQVHLRRDDQNATRAAPTREAAFLFVRAG